MEICILVHEPLYNCEIVLFFCFLCVFIVSFLACYSLMQTHVSTKKNLLKVIIVFIFIEIVLYSFAGIKLARELSGGYVLSVSFNCTCAVAGLRIRSSKPIKNLRQKSEVNF